MGGETVDWRPAEVQMVRPALLLLLVCPGVASADVVVNEILPNPTGSDGGQEFVELYNDGAAPVALDGWAIQTATSSYSTKFTFPSGTTLAAGAYLVVGEADVAGADLRATSLGMGNAGGSGDAVRLIHADESVVDTVVYGPDNSDAFLADGGAVAVPAAAPPEGRSLGRRPDGSDTEDSSVDFRVLDVPTPGASNVPPAPECDRGAMVVGVVINELLPDPNGADSGLEWVELYNGTSSELDLSDWTVQAGSSSYASVAAAPKGFTLSPGGFVVFGGADVPEADLTLVGSLGNATSNADAVRVVDCAGDAVDTVIYGADNTDAWLDDDGVVAASLAAKPGSGVALARVEDGVDTNASAIDFAAQPDLTPGSANPEPLPCFVGDLVINELLTNPEGADDELEWVELYNPSPAQVDVGGWVLDASTSGFGGGQVLEAAAVPSGGYLLLGRPGVDAADAPLTVTLGNATSNADGLQLRDCEGAVVDTVIYGSPNDDGWVDDSGSVATSLAPAPGESASLARLEDGYDQDDNAIDFVVDTEPTPGAANPVREPVVCVPDGGSGLVLNEAMVNPDGADEGGEWVELFNPSSAPVSVAGWGLASVTKPDDEGRIDVSFPGGAEVPAGGFLVIGGALVPEAEVLAALSLGNGTDGDALVLYDCAGQRVDGVVYGANNDDGVLDDTGVASEPYVTSTSSAISLARRDDGVDSDSADDWFGDATPTPGLTNLTEGSGVEVPNGGCRRDDDPPGPTEPRSGCGRDDTPAPASLFVLLVGLAGWGGRRRYWSFLNKG